MQTTVNDLIQELKGDMRTINPRNLTDIKTIFNSSKKRLLTLVTPMSLIRTVAIENGVFGNETYFEAPSDMSQDSVINIRKESSDGCECSKVFDRIKDYDESSKRYKTFDVEYNNGHKYIRIDQDATRCGTCNKKKEINCIHPFNGLNDNGHWDSFDGITSLVQDFEVNAFPNGAVSFNISKDGYIKNTSHTETYLPNQDQVITLWVNIEKPHRLKSIKYKVGTDTDYVEYIATSRHNGNTFISGLNLVKFAKINSVGTIKTPITQTKISFEIVNGDNQNCSKGECEPVKISLSCLSYRDMTPFVIKYYSRFILKNPLTGNFVEKLTDVSKQGNYIINLDDDAYMILYELVHRRMKYQKTDENSDYDISYINSELKSMIQSYNNKFPSYIKKPKVKRGNFTNQFREYGW